MDTVRTVVWGVLVGTVFAGYARAEKVTVSSNVGSWMFYITGEDEARLRAALRSYFGRFDGGHAYLAAPTTGPASVTPIPGYPTTPPPAASRAAAPAPTAAVSAAPSAPQPVVTSASSAPVSSAMTTQNATPAPAPATTPSTGGTQADAYINFNSSNLPEADKMTTGTAQPWYNSPAVQKAFGGNTPTAAQQAQFTQDVKSDVVQTFALAGMNPKVTLDPSVPANHTISVVSGLSYSGNPNAIGITDVGRNGFGFIDKLAYANDETSLAWAVAHNVSHELMHAFGVANHPDTTGNYIDTATATWDLLTNPNATFSDGAKQALSTSDIGVYSVNPTSAASAQTLIVDGEQEIIATPEPATLAGWAVVVAVACGYRFRKRRLAA